MRAVAAEIDVDRLVFAIDDDAVSRAASLAAAADAIVAPLDTGELVVRS